MEINLSRRSIVALAGSTALGLVGLSGCETGSLMPPAGMQGKTLYAKLITNQRVLGEVTDNDDGDIVTITFNSDSAWHLSGKTEWTGTYILEGENIVMSVDTYGYTQTLEKAEDGSNYTEMGKEYYWLRWFENQKDAEEYYEARVAYIPEYLQEALDGTKWSHKLDGSVATLTFNGNQLEWSVTDEDKNVRRIFESDDHWPYEDHSGEYKLVHERKLFDTSYIGQVIYADRTFDYRIGVYSNSIKMDKFCDIYDFTRSE